MNYFSTISQARERIYGRATFVPIDKFGPPPEQQLLSFRLRDDPILPYLELGTGSAQAVAPLKTITWSQLLQMLKASHNPRFCGSLNNASEWLLSKEPSGDYCAFTAGFSSIVRSALHNAPDPYRANYIKFGETNANSVNATIDIALMYYVEATIRVTNPPGKDVKTWTAPQVVENFDGKGRDPWKDLQDALANVIVSDADKAAVCAAVVKGLHAFFQKVLAAVAVPAGTARRNTTMIMIREASGVRMDVDKDGGVGYGPFGKGGSKHFSPGNVFDRMFVGVGATQSDDETSRDATKAMFVGAMVQMAGDIAYKQGY